jgi:hypothetical protein
MTAVSLNSYFVTIADKINMNTANVGHIIASDIDKYLNYLSQAFTTPFPKTELNHTSIKEIKKYN